MKVTGWAIVCTILRPDNTWFTRTITQIPDSVSGPIDDYLTEVIEEPLIPVSYTHLTLPTTPYV